MHEHVLPSDMGYGTDPEEPERRHTPGPWIVRRVKSLGDLVYCLIGPESALRRLNGVAYAGVYGKNKRGEVGGVRQTEEECLANAHLIAAAPELLAACEQVLFDANLEVRDGVWCEIHENTIKAVAAAITKARA